MAKRHVAGLSVALLLLLPAAQAAMMHDSVGDRSLDEAVRDCDAKADARPDAACGEVYARWMRAFAARRKLHRLQQQKGTESNGVSRK